MDPTLRLKGLAAPTAAAPTEIVLLDRGDRLVGRLRFRVCPSCRTGRILDIWIGDRWQRQGLGRELTHSLLARHPGHRWSTTPQTREGRAFFREMTEETGVPLPRGGPLCRHLMGALRRGWRSALEHWPHR
ncbi:GNAT family N-acetyltransferase [Streptomyces sp. DH24]|uniref:GNAT family N-acetyltransferase n=1 Tax=Streptomyces sp. DH24 TaxID=3040123 RepID=UPI0024430B1B|nr:GNAT family N-acetyltransferase [Streptomyces sp. DH24]MDG9715455.1 N-acetyltransferase [Streptomyces sp. DH24]